MPEDMTSAVNIPIVSAPNLEKIENFFNDSSYRETIEFSANFNTRLSVERRLRLPFLDPQTGVAQNHSQLFVSKRHRMPGFKQGQIYTYPAARWRKSRRQYLNKMYKFPDRPFQALRKEHEALVANASTTSRGGTCSPTVAAEADFNGALLDESSSLGAPGGDTSDSNSQHHQQHTTQQQQQKEELPKDWFYDEMDINDGDSMEDPKSADDEYDYDPRYGSKKRRKRRPGKRATIIPGESIGTGRRRAGVGRGRNTLPAADLSLDSLDGTLADGSTTPTTSTGRRPRGTGSRGRRRTKLSANETSMGIEPPSFESAAAAVGVTDMAVEEHGDLRNYRKYL